MKGVVGVGHKKRTVDQVCMVRFVCPECGISVTEDAYEGPVYDATCRRWMEPVAIVATP